MKSKYKKLFAIYAKIPKVECKGLCHESCTIAPAAKIEIKRAKDAFISSKIQKKYRDINRFYMTISELIEALKYAQDPNEPELEVFMSDNQCGAFPVRYVARKTVFKNGIESAKTVAMLVRADNDSQ